MLQSRLLSFSVPLSRREFREARERYTAFKTLIQRRSMSEPEQSRGPCPSWSENQRRAKKVSVATHAHPPPAARARGRSVSKRGRQDLRDVIQMKRSQLRSSGTE